MHRLHSLSQHIRRVYLQALTELSRLPLAMKLSLITAVLLGLCSIVLLAASQQGSRQLEKQQREAFANFWAEQIAYQAQQGLLQNDRLNLTSVLQFNQRNGHLKYAAILDTDQQVLVEIGNENSRSPRYTADISLGADIAGSVIIVPDSSASSRDRLALNWQLLVLAMVLVGLLSAMVYRGGYQLEKILLKVRQQLLHPGKAPIAPGYHAEDALGKLLATLSENDPKLPSSTPIEAHWIILQLHWSSYERLTQQLGKAELERRINKSYNTALALSRVYQARLSFKRGDGLSLRFSENHEGQSALQRALCCTYILQRIDKDLGASPRLGMIRQTGNRLQLEAAEATLCQTLAELPGKSGIITKLPGDLLEELNEWTDCNEFAVREIKAQYQTLLERQLSRIQEQLATAP